MIALFVIVAATGLAVIAATESRWRTAVCAQMAQEMFSAPTWRGDQRARALVQRMGAYGSLPWVRQRAWREAYDVAN